jgi:hypothetical protein
MRLVSTRVSTDAGVVCRANLQVPPTFILYVPGQHKAHSLIISKPSYAATKVAMLAL